MSSPSSSAKRPGSPPPSAASSDNPAKRQATDPPTEACFFGTECYRRNPHHFLEYSHAHLEELCVKYPSRPPPNSALASFKVGSEVVQAQLRVYKDVRKKFVSESSSSAASLSTAATSHNINSSSPKPTVSVPVAAAAVVPAASSSSQTQESRRPKSLIQKKLESAQPMSLFLTKVKDSPDTHKDMDSIYIAELLHPSLGKLKRSVQINFMVEWDWLKMNYEVSKNDDKPLLIVYGEENPDLSPSNLPSHIRAVRVKPRYPFGTHHTKMMLLHYEDDSVRVVVHTANLVSSDWENRTQGVWVGPKCPKMAAADAQVGAGDSKTGFKSSLLRYLKFYELTPLKTYIDCVKTCDFSAVNVFFLASVPNSHRGPDLNLWGHKGLAAILRKYASNHQVADRPRQWPVVTQCSSIGSLGAQPGAWFAGELLQSLSATANNKLASPSSLPPLKLVYPSKQDVLGSYDGIFGGGCLPYSEKTHMKQPWLRDFMHNWSSNTRKRSRAMPHIKTYTRLDTSDDDMAKASYFVLTSANLSKAAWGSLNKSKENLLIMSYEAGVVFLPSFVTGNDFFVVGKKGDELSLPYDLPLKKYREGETPWFMDYLRRECQ